MSERIRTILLVGFVTLLIWVYAEAESLTQVQEEVQVRFVTNAPDVVVRPVSEDWRGVVRVRMEGAAAALARAPRVIELPLGAPGVPDDEGEHTVDLRAALRASEAIGRASVTLLDVDPPATTVRVRELSTMDDVEVRVDLGGIELAGPPAISPRTAAVTAGRAALDQLRSLGAGAHVVARISPDELEGLPEGQPVRFSTRLTLPAGVDASGARLVPAEAEVTITLRSRTETARVESVPVNLLMLPGDSARYEVSLEVDDVFVRDVTVTGPAITVERIRSGELQVVAVLRFSSDELEQGISSKAVTFAAISGVLLVDLPDGLLIDAPQRVVRFRVTPVTPASAAP